jgi:hypothetical protein
VFSIGIIGLNSDNIGPIPAPMQTTPSLKGFQIKGPLPKLPESPESV